MIIVYSSRSSGKKNANNKGRSDWSRGRVGGSPTLPTSAPLHRATNQSALCYSHFSSRYSDWNTLLCAAWICRSPSSKVAAYPARGVFGSLGYSVSGLGQECLLKRDSLSAWHLSMRRAPSGEWGERVTVVKQGKKKLCSNSGPQFCPSQVPEYHCCRNPRRILVIRRVLWVSKWCALGHYRPRRANPFLYACRQVWQGHSVVLWTNVYLCSVWRAGS